MMLKWTEAKIHSDLPIKEAVAIIDKSTLQIGLVVDENDKLIGVVTDGDIRRSLLKDLSLDSPVKDIMTTTYVYARDSDSNEQILKLIYDNNVRQVPVLDEHGKIVELKTLMNLYGPNKIKNDVIIMAGGLGKRLMPITENYPKPMIEIGGKPILERIITNFKRQGFENFYISVNYKADVIKQYFDCGTKWGIKITYLHEKQRLGTAGSLSLIPERPIHPMIVMNGDILTDINFESLLKYHEDQNVLGTMCVRKYDLQVPFGVASIKENRLTGIDEKPIHSFFVNAGMYVIEPSVLDLIQKQCYLDMTSLFMLIIKSGESAAYPLREYWLDIGRHSDLEKAQSIYKKEVKNK